MSTAGELRSTFTSPTGGVMTHEVGSITGDLELLTVETGVGMMDALVRYVGAEDWYTVEGSPVSMGEDHSSTHKVILARLGTPGPVEFENEQPTDLSSGV